MTHFKITNITNGTLFHDDGTTPVVTDQFLTLAQAAPRLKFTPTAGGTATGSFQVQAALDATGTGLSPAATATITVIKHDTATTTSALPDPSDRFQNVVVQFTVASLTGGPVPTGDVLVTSDAGSQTCTGTLTAGVGQCTVAYDAAGPHTITASYQGDAVNNSSSDTESHTVTACPAAPVVTNTNDAGPGSLRQAIADACNTDTITFDLPGGGTIGLVSGELVLTKNLTITGPTTAGVTISAQLPSRVLTVVGFTTVSLSNVTIVNGRAADGGGILNSGTLVLRNSLLAQNDASNSGGAIRNNGTLTLLNSTVSNNQSAHGGGVWNNSGATATIVNSTITQNRAGVLGTGIGNEATLTIENSIVAGNFTSTGLADLFNAGTVNDQGHNLINADSATLGLGPLAMNGGPTGTHALLAGSPALDAGDNLAATAAGLTTDQRGAGYTRILDSADANTTRTVDIGAHEQHPSIADIAPQTMNEDAVKSVLFQVGDGDLLAASEVTVSSDTALVPNVPGNLNITGSGAERTVNITPAPHQFGTATITVTVTETSGGVPQTMSDTFLLTVTNVNDPPTLDQPATPLNISEDATEQTVGLTGITVGPGGEPDTLTIMAVSDNPSVIPHPNVSHTPGQTTAALTYTPVANASGTAVITVTVTDNGSPAMNVIRTFTVVVTPSADTPVVTNATTNEDTQTTSGLVITPNVADTAGVTHFKITGITNGTLYQVDGSSQITDGMFISVAEGAAGLKFTPVANSFGTGSFTVQASVSDVDAGLGGGTATASITIAPIGDAPGFTGASTSEDVQSTSGLVLTRHAADGVEVTHFKITAIANGMLFKNNGTPIPVNGIITFDEGNAGLKFTPAANFSGSASVTAQAVTSAAGAGGGVTTLATIAVSAVADTPSVTNTVTPVNSQSTTGLVISRNVADGAEVTHVKITTITGGTLFQQNGMTPIRQRQLHHGGAGQRRPAVHADAELGDDGPLHGAGLAQRHGRGLGRRDGDR